MNTLTKIVNFAQKAFKVYQDTQKNDSVAEQSHQSAPSHSPSTSRTAPSPSQQAHNGEGYPGDYTGNVSFEYAPENDGDPDPGEVVWAWVPFQEDYFQGKDRPVLIIGKNNGYFLTLMLTSKDHNNSSHHDDRYLDIGSGSWDKSDRPSEVNLGRVIQIAENKIRREGSILDEATFNRVRKAFQQHNRG